jgi:hypothetical protein
MVRELRALKSGQRPPTAEELDPREGRRDPRHAEPVRHRQRVARHVPVAGLLRAAARLLAAPTSPRSAVDARQVAGGGQEAPQPTARRSTSSSATATRRSSSATAAPIKPPGGGGKQLTLRAGPRRAGGGPGTLGAKGGWWCWTPTASPCPDAQGAVVAGAVGGCGPISYPREIAAKARARWGGGRADFTLDRRPKTCENVGWGSSARFETSPLCGTPRTSSSFHALRRVNAIVAAARCWSR